MNKHETRTTYDELISIGISEVSDTSPSDPTITMKIFPDWAKMAHTSADFDEDQARELAQKLHHFADHLENYKIRRALRIKLANNPD